MQEKINDYSFDINTTKISFFQISLISNVSSWNLADVRNLSSLDYVLQH